MSCSVTGFTSSIGGRLSVVLLVRLLRGWLSGIQSGSLARSRRVCFLIGEEGGEMGDGERLPVGVRSLAGSPGVFIVDSLVCAGCGDPVC